MSKRKIIGVCSCGVSVEYNDNICNGIIEYAKKFDNVRIIFYSSFLNGFEHTSNDVGEMSIFNIINFNKLDGLIILGQTIKDSNIIDKIFENAKRNNVPAVCFDYESDNCSEIIFDAAEPIYEMTCHLIEKHNCKKINFMAGSKKDLLSIIRSNAYMKALSAHNLPVDRNRIGEGFWWTFTAEEACKEWIKSGMEFDAVVCANDIMAISVIKALKDNGIKVPEQVKVVGIDNITEGRYHSPSITTADFCYSEAACNALDILLGLKDEGRYVKNPEMHFRKSCGCADDCENLDFNSFHREMYTNDDINQVENENLFNFTSKMIEQPNVESAKKYLNQHIQKLWTAKAWICINRDLIEKEDSECFNPEYDDVQSLPKNYSKYVKVIAAKSDDSGDLDKEILVEELCPNFDKVIDECMSILVCPLHINDNIFGYIVKEHKNNFTMERWHSLSMNISTSLLAVKQQNEMKLANKRLEEMYIRDSMTRIYNRRGFFRMLKRYMMTAVNKKIIVISVDLDGLKKINDSYGHLEGDNALIVTAQSLVKSAGENQICARFGGDEFIVAGPYDEDYDFEEHFQRLLDIYNSESKKPYEVKASIGYVIKECDSFKDFDELIKLADEKMYLQKTQRNGAKIRGGSRETPQKKV